jgi:flagellar hook-associated protein 2
MAPITISGLASGLDTESIVANLMAIERAPRARMELRQGQVKAREAALREILSKLDTVSGAAESLRSPTLWSDVQTVRSSAPESVAARRLSGAGPGGYQVEVSQLARAEQRTYAFTQSPVPTQLTIGGRTIELGAGATLGDAVAAINADAETGVYAVDVGGRLVLSSRQTGAANTIAASGEAIAEEAAKLKPGLDALYSVDGVASSSASNTLADAVPGLELTLGAVTPGVTVTVGEPGPDKEAISSAVKAFVDAYNAAVDAIRGRLTEKRIPSPASQAEANRGTLFGDTALNGLLSRLRGAVSESGIGALGVGTGAPSASVSADSDSVLGHLTIDEAKLTAALEADPAAARAALTGSGGLADALGGVLEPVLGSKGGISQRLDATAAEAARIRDSMTALDSRLETREERLRAQFAAMESALSRAKSESAWLTGQLAGLSGDAG